MIHLWGVNCSTPIFDSDLIESPVRSRAVAIGKDAVPRATVANMTRLMDEVVTALARCKQPKLKVCGHCLRWSAHSLQP